MYNTEIRHASWNQQIPSVQSQDAPATVAEEKDVLQKSSDTNVISHPEGERKDVSQQGFFKGCSVRQVSQRAYIVSNRAAVVSGLVAGAIGLPVGQGITGAVVGANVGGNFGFLAGAVVEVAGKRAPSLEKEPIATEAEFIDGSEPSLIGHALEAVDHAGHMAAVASLGAGAAIFGGSLLIGHSVALSMNSAVSYSGAAWMFGLTTGAAQWIIRALEREAIPLPAIVREMTIARVPPAITEVEMTPLAHHAPLLQSNED